MIPSGAHGRQPLIWTAVAARLFWAGQVDTRILTMAALAYDRQSHATRDTRPIASQPAMALPGNRQASNGAERYAHDAYYTRPRTH